MTDTVELPADPELKQLANDVVTEDNEDLVPILLDFYEFLSTLNDDDWASMGEITVDEPESDVSGETWKDLLDSLESQEMVKKDPPTDHLF